MQFRHKRLFLGFIVLRGILKCSKFHESIVNGIGLLVDIIYWLFVVQMKRFVGLSGCLMGVMGNESGESFCDRGLGGVGCGLGWVKGAITLIENF